MDKHRYVLKKEATKMITISKQIETLRKDLNNEDSFTVDLFEKITSFLFKGVVILGIPLVTFMLLFI